MEDVYKEIPLDYHTEDHGGGKNQKYTYNTNNHHVEEFSVTKNGMEKNLLHYPIHNVRVVVQEVNVECLPKMKSIDTKIVVKDLRVRVLQAPLEHVNDTQSKN